ncbi:MAG: HYR domain-containing protein, partial [Flavobacteriales bacterium]
MVTYTTPVGTDNCTGSTTTRTAGLASGSTFPIGTTTVTHQVTEAAGLTASCSFTVTVVDAQAPAISCPANINVNAGAACTATASWLTPGMTDNCPGAIMTQTAGPVSGSIFPLGTTVITYTATDAAGNVSTCSFNVNIIDATAPIVVNCPSNIALNSGASCSVPASWSAPSVTDNCAGASIAQTAGPASGSSFPIGITTIVYTATDAGGNTSTCSFTVTVTDNLVPSISCPADISVNNTVGTCGAVVTYTTPVGTDNCAGSTTTRTAGLASGSTFPVGTTT